MLVGTERHKLSTAGVILPPLNYAEAKRKATDEDKRRAAAYRNTSSEQNLKIPRSNKVNRQENAGIETINLRIIEQYKIQINAEIVRTNLLTNYTELFERIYDLVSTFIEIKEKLNEIQIQEFRMQIIQLLILVKSQLIYNIYNIIRIILAANFNTFFKYFEISKNNGDYVLNDSILNVFALSIYEIFKNITQTLDIDINQYPSTIINTEQFIIPYTRLNTRIDMQFDILAQFSEKTQVDDDTPILNLVKLSESILQQNHKVEETPKDIKEEEKAKNQALIIERSLLEGRSPAASSGASSYQGSGSEQSSRESLEGSAEEASAPPAPPAAQSSAQSAPPAAQSSAEEAAADLSEESLVVLPSVETSEIEESAPPSVEEETSEKSAPQSAEGLNELLEASATAGAESEAESGAESGAVSGAVSREVSQLRSEEAGVSVNNVSLEELEMNQDTSEENLESKYDKAEKVDWEKYYLQVFEIKDKKLMPDILFAFKNDVEPNFAFKTKVLKLYTTDYLDVYSEPDHTHCFIFESIIENNRTPTIENTKIKLLDKFKFNTLYFYA